MNKFIRFFVLPVGILAIGGVVIWLLMQKSPQARKEPPQPQRVTPVNIVELQPTQHQVIISHRGVVRAKQQSQLTAHSSGKITYISPEFRVGSKVKKGQILVKLDAKKYQIAMQIQKAQVISAKASVDEEEARGQIALDNWRLSGKQKPNDLVLRKPQLAAAKGQLQIAQKRLEQAVLDLKETTIRAPFDAIVVSTKVNQGEFKNINSQLGQLLDIKSVEIRVAIKEQEQRFIPHELPLIAHVHYADTTYAGTVIAKEPQVDALTQQQFYIIEVANPFDYPRPLIPNVYANVDIEATVLKNISLLPINAIQSNADINILVDGTLQKSRPNILFRDKNHIVIEAFDTLTQVITTPLGNLPIGSKLKIK